MLCNYCTELPVYTLEIKNATTEHVCAEHLPEYLVSKALRGQIKKYEAPVKPARKPRTPKNVKAVEEIPSE
jgi:hypothetical protein